MTPTQKAEEILELAEKGKKPTEIANLLGLVPVSTSQFLNRHGYSYEYLNQGNTRYFKNINNANKAYILGFIAADGYIVQSNPSSETLGIQINIEDREVLDFVREEIGFKKELTYPNEKMIRMTLSNKDLVQDLKNLGITKRKSLTLTNILNNIPKKFRKYCIFGYFDGDGSCTRSKQTSKKFCKSENKTKTYKSLTMTISIRGTKDLLQGIIDELNLQNYSFFKNKTWVLNFSKHQETIRFYKMYKESPFQLTRKLATMEKAAKLIIDKYSKVQTISSPFYFK